MKRPAKSAKGKPAASHHAGEDLPKRAKQGIVIAIMLALFLGALDQTIVGTALPQIITDLNGANLYTWVVTIYLLASTVTVPIYGKLSDMYGRKPLLLTGVGLFLIGSALAGLSQTIEQLILFRGIQGLGAGALFPIALATIGDLYSAKERGRYQGLFGAVFGLSSLVGPALGGWLTDTFSWRSCKSEDRRPWSAGLCCRNRSCADWAHQRADKRLCHASGCRPHLSGPGDPWSLHPR
jgi:MFS family permease